MNETTASPSLRLIVGIVDGAVVGDLLLLVFDRREPPVPVSSIVLPALAGAFSGALLSLLIGARRVSVFWPNLVVVFGIITGLPWWWYEKTHSFLPLGTIYVNWARAAMLKVFIPHLLVSVAIAAGLTILHRRLFVRPTERT